MGLSRRMFTKEFKLAAVKRIEGRRCVPIQKCSRRSASDRA